MKKTPREKFFLQMLSRRAERLAKLTELDAPFIIIQNEFGMVCQTAAGLFGKSILEYLVTNAAKHERWRAGFCMEESCATKLTTKEELIEGICSLHIEEEKSKEGFRSRLDIYPPNDDEETEKSKTN